MNVPGWYTLILLALAAFRVWKLLAEDTILDRPRRYVTRHEYLETLITCPWCLGFWLAVAWWGAWEAWPHWTLIVAVPWALGALVPLAHKLTSMEE